jgi:hypothetical protein
MDMHFIHGADVSKLWPALTGRKEDEFSDTIFLFIVIEIGGTITSILNLSKRLDKNNHGSKSKLKVQKSWIGQNNEAISWNTDVLDALLKTFVRLVCYRRNVISFFRLYYDSIWIPRV